MTTTALHDKLLSYLSEQLHLVRQRRSVHRANHPHNEGVDKQTDRQTTKGNIPEILPTSQTGVSSRDVRNRFLKFRFGSVFLKQEVKVI